MDSKKFVELAIDKVKNYANDHLDKSEPTRVSTKDVYVVWLVTALQNNKALLSTTLSDGMYYEATYNGSKHELYLDAYKHFENQEFDVDQEF